MIKVLSAGVYTTIQDLGRFGHAHLGVPVSGAMDQYSAKLANNLLDNNENNSVLEITLGKVILLFRNQAIVSLTGSNMSPRVNSRKVALNTVVNINRGDILTFNKSSYGVRCYMAIKDGFKTEKILGSRSYFKGITSNFFIKKGDVLPYFIQNTDKNFNNSSVKVNEEHFTSKIIEVYKGPEYGLLNSEQKRQIEETTFTISKDNNRMGYRLVEKIKNSMSSMLTSSTLPGTVQLTPSGTLIILMRDCQVTGGYPRILQLTEVSINKMAQKTTNNKIQIKITDF